MEERYHRKNIRCFSIILSFLFVITAWAGEGFEVNYKQLSTTKAQLDFNINDYQLTEVELGGTTYSKIEFAGTVVTEQLGFAEVPVVSATVQLQPFGDIDLKVVSEDYVDIVLSKPLLPSRGVIYRNQDPASIPYNIAKSSLIDAWYPAVLTRNSKPFIFRDVRGTSIYVHPFRYNAVKNVLRVYKNVSVQFEASRKSSTNALTKMNPIVPTMDRIYRTMFVNYGMGAKTRSADIGELGDILVLYTSRDKGAIQPYIEWKRQKGFRVFERQVAKGTNVKDIIKEEYDSNNRILYVQLVGDWEDIKSDTGPSSAPMDPMLGKVVGDDWFADIIVARFSAKRAADVTVQVEKTIRYEKNPDLDGTWYKRAIGIGSNEGDGKGDDGEADWKHMDVIRDNKLLPTTYNLVHQDYAKNGVTADRVGQHVNEGVGLINYVGHGSTDSWVTSRFDNDDVANLRNGEMMPFIVSVACVNGEFHSSEESFAEAWLKKADGGAIGAWMSTINQPWAPPMRGQDYFVDLLIGGYDYDSNPGHGTNIYEQRTTYGSLTLNAAHLMYAEDDSSSDLKTIQTWTVFGDGSLQVRTDTPKAIEISNQVVLMGVPFTTIVSGPEGPVKNAMVSLYQNGKSFVGLTDDLGAVTIEHELEVEKVQITVTAFNTTTIAREVDVVPPNGPFVSVTQISLDGDGQADYGERVSLDVVLKNLGNDDASNVEARIETDSPYVVSIDDADASTSYLGSGKVKRIKNAFSIRFAYNVPDQTAVLFKVLITDHTGDVYESKVSIVVNAPVLNYSFAILGEGTLQPGDSRDLKYEVANTGHAKVFGVNARLDYLGDLDVAIGNGDQFIGDLAPGASATALFSVDFGSGISSGASALFRLQLLADGGIQVNFDQGIVVGMTESFETGSWGSFWSFSDNADWIVDSDAAVGAFAGKSGDIGDKQKSTVTFNAHFAAAGAISFYRKVSSEARYDKLKFYIDGVEQENWSGEVAWEQVTYDVPAGTHQFKWSYEKDGSVDKGSDCAWIDNVLATGGVVL